MKHRSSIWSVAFSPDGKTFLTSSFDETVRLWETATGKELKLFPHNNKATNVLGISKDGKTIVTARRENAARFWDVTWPALGTLVQHQGRIWGLDFSRDNKGTGQIRAVLSLLPVTRVAIQ